MAFWGVEVKPKKPLPLMIERRLVAKQAALVIDKPSSEPCVLSVSVMGRDEQYVVCRLHEGRLEHCTLELPFSPSDNVTLHLQGPHKLHLTGFLDIDDEDDLDEMDEEMAASGKGRVGGLGDGFGDGDEDEDDEDESDDQDYDDADEGEDDDEGDDDDDDDDEAEEEDDDDEEEEDDEEDDEEVVVAPQASRKRPAAPNGPSSKAAKVEAATPSSKPKPAPSLGDTPPTNPWTKDEEGNFAKAIAKYKDGTEGRWKKIAAAVGTRNPSQCKKKAQMEKNK